MDMKLKIIALRLNFPLGCFHHDMFRVRVGDIQKSMFCLLAGSMADENPAYLELAPTPEVSLMLRKREFQILVPPPFFFVFLVWQGAAPIEAGVFSEVWRLPEGVVL